MAFLFYFEPMAHICLNGELLDADNPVLMASDRSYRYGDGLFETMRVVNGRILLSDLHFERLFSSLQTLKFEIPSHLSKDFFEMEITKLCQKNKCTDSARVRLSVSRGEGGLYDGNNRFHYLIESWPLDDTMSKLNENGLVIDIYPDARKSIDKFSNLKSTSFLPYVMAAHWTKENKLNDALVLNSYERITDSTIANIFWVKNNIIFTPPLSEGCIAGVMRRYLLENSGLSGFTVKEQMLYTTDLQDVDEVFLTNVIRGIRWVKQFRDKQFSDLLSSEIYHKLVKTIWE